MSYNYRSDRHREESHYKDPGYPSFAPDNRISNNDFSYTSQYAYFQLDTTFPGHHYSTEPMNQGYTPTEPMLSPSNVNPSFIAAPYGPLPTVSPTQVERPSQSPPSQQSSPMSNSDDESPEEQHNFDANQLPQPYEEHELEPAIDAVKQKVDSHNAESGDFDRFIRSVAYPNKANTGPGSRGGNQGHECIYPKCSHKMFRRRDRARHHVELHFNAKLEICGKCGKGFTRRYDMQRHERSCKNGGSGINNASGASASSRTRGHHKSVRESCPGHSGSFCLVCRGRDKDSEINHFWPIHVIVVVARVFSFDQVPLCWWLIDCG